jgi:cytochrome P450
MGLRVPKGATVVVAPYFLHRHARYWPEPLKFDPDRFLPARIAERPRFAFLPFGAGPRVCIGARLATLEVKLLLTLLLQRFRIERAHDGELQPEGLFALRAKEGVPVRLRRAS